MSNKLFLLALVVSQSLAAENFKGDSTLEKSVKAMYNYKYDEAIFLSDSVKTHFPSNPGAPLVWAAAKWLKSQATESTDVSSDTLKVCVKNVIPIYESLMKQYPDEPIYQLYYGSAKGLSARISLGEKDWLNTLLRSYQGFRQIEKAFEKDPELWDAHLPIGIVEYYAGISSVFLQWLVDLYGLNPSVHSGLERMEEAAQHSQWAWIEAKGILAFLYLWVEDQPSWALKHTSDLVLSFPRNYYFYLLHLESLIRTGNQDEAEYYLSLNEPMQAHLTQRQLSWYEPYLMYEKALYEYEFNDLDTSLSYLEQTIDTYDAELDIILGNAFLLKGKIYDRYGDRKNALSAYNQCIDLNNFSSAMKQANTYIHSPFMK